MGWFKNETPYERKMRELEEEADRIRKNMRTLMRNIDTGTTVTERSTAAVSAAMERSTQNSRTRPPVSSVPEVQEPPYSADDEVPFVEESEETGDQSNFASGETTPDSTRATFGFSPHRSPSASRPDNLAAYLASGSFGKRGSLSRERKIQRNKAIFMLIFALLAVFSLISWFR